MENYVEDLRFIKEPDNEDCSTGIVPVGAGKKEKEDKRTIIVPELTSMTKFLFDNYRDDMVQYLNDTLRSGYLREIVGFHFLNKKLYRNNYDFSDVSYWRVDRESFIADVHVDLFLNTGKAIQTWRGFLNLWFHVDQEITCSIEYLAAIEDLADEDLPRLSNYLVPILTNRQIDEEAETIWIEHMPEALSSPEQRSAINLAHKMGLSIRYLPVYQHQDTDSILFFEDGEIPALENHVEDEEEREPKDRFDSSKNNSNQYKPRPAGVFRVQYLP